LKSWIEMFLLFSYKIFISFKYFSEFGPHEIFVNEYNIIKSLGK
jgi:hypothetical protein